MRKTLIIDPDTRELRLRYDDLYRGRHERTEYRVTDARTDGHVIRNYRGDLGHLDGLPVFGDSVTHEVRPERRAVLIFWTQDAPVADTVKTPCPRATNARKRCQLCAAAA